MAIRTCPTDVVRASPERVWDLLTIPSEVARWSASTLLAGPERLVRAGDRIVLGVGPGGWLRAELCVLDLAQPHRLALDVRLPFGIVNHEIVQIAPVGAGESRVTYN